MVQVSWNKVLIILATAVIIAVIVLFGYFAYLFDQHAKQSERHDFHYSIDLSYNTTIEHVTLLLPVPERNGTPLLPGLHEDGILYGVPSGWNLSMEVVNGSPMLAIRAEEMIPEYHGRPIPIEPGQSPLPTTLVPGTEYSEETPILQPIHLGLMLQMNRTIDTRNPVAHEPVFAPGGVFIEGKVSTTPYEGKEYTHIVPIFVEYTSERPAAVYIRISIRGTNSIWKGGWVYNSYEDSVTLEREESPGWVDGRGILRTEEGVYYS